jgi:DegV family protein with EDD domain
MTKINGKDLFHMFAYGTSYVVKQRRLLNDINVFPVPDGDTGNNLVHTMQTISRESKVSDSFHETLDSISNSALIGARGNSGVIFAQFVNGLRSASNGQSSVSLDEFTKMALDSVDHTYASLSNPVEGTMITVIKSWANTMFHNLPKITNVKEFFHAAFQNAKAALEQTKEQLKVLKQNNVVDSGAMGFVLFLEGINSYFDGEILEVVESEEIELEDVHEFEGEINYRYCTEGLVDYQNAKEADVKNALNDLGDSLITAFGTKMFRVHIHTNNPELVFDRLSSFGTITSQKIDDMMMDVNLKNTKQKTVIVTDSIADINPDILLDNNIVVIPLNINLDQITYLDKLSMNNEVLFEKIESALEYPTTSTPSIKYINDLFSRLLLRFDEIIVLTVSGALSATHRVIKDETEKLVKKGKNITVIDTKTNSVAEGLLVEKAAKLLKEGKTASEIKTIIDESKQKSKILVCLETFKYATMSGRLPKAVGKIGMALRMRPIMSIDENGKGAAFGFAFSKKGITKKIVKYVEKELSTNEIESYGLVHCLADDLVKEYEAIFTDIIGKKPSYIANVSSATAIHSGVGTVAIGYIKK